MFSKFWQTTRTDAKEEDSSASSQASLSSASAHTLDHETSTQQTQLSARQVENPPSYEYATSLSDSQHTSLAAAPSSSSLTSEINRSSDTRPTQVLQTDNAEPSPEIDQRWAPKSDVKLREGDHRLLSSETITGSVVITGNLTILGKVRFIGCLEVQKSLRILGALTMDGPLRVAQDINNHNKLSVSETTDVGSKFNNYSKAVFAKHVTHGSNVSNYGTLTYNNSVDFGMAAISNFGTINAGHGVSNTGKVTNLGKLNGLSSF